MIGRRNQTNIAYKLLQIHIAAFRTVDVTDQSNLTCGLYLLQACTHFNGLTGLKRNGLRRNLVRHGLALTLCICLGEVVPGGNGRVVLRALACAGKLLAFKEFDFLLLISGKRS